MAQGFRALPALPVDPGSFYKTTLGGTQLPVTPEPGDPISFFGSQKPV